MFYFALVLPSRQNWAILILRLKRSDGAWLQEQHLVVDLSMQHRFDFHFYLIGQLDLHSMSAYPQINR